ncbi:MAG: cytochrome b/b6 domain-containing protein, partial [Gallionella sp.]
RLKDGTPPAMGQGVMDKVATGVHHLLYLLLFILPVSGILTVINSTVLKGLLEGEVSLLPKDGDFDHVFAHSVHETLVTGLIVLVVVHLLGAIKHQFIVKDGLLERMMLRRK